MVKLLRVIALALALAFAAPSIALAKTQPADNTSSGKKADKLDLNTASEDELKKIDAQVRDIVNEAAEFATNDPEPDPAKLWTNVYR